MRCIEVGDLAFSHSDAVPLFEGTSLRLGSGFAGLVGENGAGKTTLLEILAGLREPDAGCVRLEPENARVTLVAQRVEHRSDAEISFARDSSRASERLRAALELHPTELERWATLSPGERKRWQIGAALRAEPDVLLLDEPTNHLDARARKLLIEALRSYRGIALVVSHDRELLDALTTRTLRLHPGGRIDDYPGAYSRARAEWQSVAAQRTRAREERREELRVRARQLDQSRRTHASADRARSSRARMKNPKDRDARSVGEKFRASRAEASLSRAKTRQARALDRAQTALEAAEVEKTLGTRVFVDYEPMPKPVIAQLDSLDLFAGPARILRDVRLTLRRGARVHVQGGNGAGKTTLLRAVLDYARLPRDRVLFLAQDSSREDDRARRRLVAELPPKERGRVLSIVAALGVDPARVLESAAPSPGESQKLALALGLGRHAWLLVLDEPTNHLDLPSIERLEAAIAEFPGALLLVSHDGQFARRLTNEAWRVSEGRVEPSYDG